MIDPIGATASEEISLTVTIDDGRNPTVNITAPAPGERVLRTSRFDSSRQQYFVDVTFRGTGSDFQGNSLTGSALAWRTNRGDLQSTSLGTGTRLTARLYADRDIQAGETERHVITLTATDGAGRTRSTSIFIDIEFDLI